MDIKSLYTTRLLVFMEDKPQSNQYRQVFLSPEEFKAVSFSIGTITGEKNSYGDEIVDLQLSSELIKLPDLKEIHYEEDHKT